MRLRNSRVLFLLVALFFIHLASGAQQPAATSSSTAQESPAVTPQATPSANTAPAQPVQDSTQSPPASTPASTEAPPQDGAQAPPPADDSGVFVFKKQVEEVVLHAVVVDSKMHLITNLSKADFTVLENGKPQPITSFRQEDVPVDMGIVIDNSGSMREKRDQVNKAALNLVRSSNPQDQVFVVNFNDEFYLDQDFTSDINKLRQALEKVESRGGTALYDALVASWADYLKKDTKLPKKVIFVVTDGEDNASRSTLEETVRSLSEENGPTIYAIGLLGEEKERKARRALQTLAERTGGIAFLPKTLGEVDEISKSVAHDIRSQYTIGYKPTTPKSVGGYRSIHVDAQRKGAGRLTVRTRSGYYAGQDAGPGGKP